MNRLTASLKMGGLKPKERVLMLVHNDVTKDKTDQETLTEADKHALVEGWRPENNTEVAEYNRYNEGWRIIGCAELDMQTTFLNAQTEHYRKQPIMFNLLYYPRYRDMRSALKRLKEIKCVNIREAIEITERQEAVKLKNGLDFDYATYQLAFELLSDEDKKRFNELYPDIETDHTYLDQEEIIAHLLAGKDALTAEAKGKLAQLVAEKSYNAFAKEYQLFHYFACIPLAEVARYFLISKNITIDGKALSQNQEADDEDSATHDTIHKAIELYAKNNNISVEAILKEACLKWLDEDLFERYTPLSLSSDSELFKKWIATKTKARTALKKHVGKGELAIRDRSPSESRQDKLYSKGLYDDELIKARIAMEIMDVEVNSEQKGELDEKTVFATFDDTVITGESLYAFTGDYAFVKDFKGDVDTYNANLGLVYADDDPEHHGEHADQELLLADTNSKGELHIFSVFGMTTTMLNTLFEGGVFFKETEKDGAVMLEFKNAFLEAGFRGMIHDLTKWYAILLSFDALFKKLSKIYEIDLSYKSKKWLDTLGQYIDDHNNTLRQATGQIQDEDDGLLRKRRAVLQIDQSFFIDKEKIEPSKERVETYFKKLEDIFGSEFESL